MSGLGAMKGIGGVSLKWDFAMRYIGNKPMMKRCHRYDLGVGFRGAVSNLERFLRGT